MVHIAPGEMVPASQVIEFVAEVSVTIVEVEMHQEIRQRQKRNDEHAVREKAPILIIEPRRLAGCAFHFAAGGYARILNMFQPQPEIML